MSKTITDVTGISVGHSSNFQAMTGCTVILIENGGVVGVDIRGSASGTRETDTLSPLHIAKTAHAILLTGGSAFGLDAACGAARFLEERGVGFDVGITKVPIVVCAVIYDLNVGDYRIRPDNQMGYDACRRAKRGVVEEGSVGVGVGATVGHFLGERWVMKGGIGTWSIRKRRLIVGAIAVVNSFGNVLDVATNKVLAGARDPKRPGALAKMTKISSIARNPFKSINTTIAVVATNAKLTKSEAQKVAQLGQNGIVRSIYPAHTVYDGDTVFAISKGKETADVTEVGLLAEECVSQSIRRGIMCAKGLGSIPSYSDFEKAG